MLVYYLFVYYHSHNFNELLFVYHLVGPEFSFSHSIEINETESLNLEFVTKGYPTPPIELFFKNKSIGSENASLNFENKINYFIPSVSRKRDNGIYICKFNDVVEEINVTVFCKFNFLFNYI